MAQTIQLPTIQTNFYNAFHMLRQMRGTDKLKERKQESESHTYWQETLNTIKDKLKNTENQNFTKFIPQKKLIGDFASRVDLLKLHKIAKETQINLTDEISKLMVDNALLVINFIDSIISNASEFKLKLNENGFYINFIGSNEKFSFAKLGKEKIYQFTSDGEEINIKTSNDGTPSRILMSNKSFKNSESIKYKQKNSQVEIKVE